MKVQVLLLPLLALSVARAQRGSYAGMRPISNGLKGPFPAQNTQLNNRFGGDNTIDAAPARLPVDALGDVHLVNKLSLLPEHQQPFWLLNYQHIEAHRNQPQLTGLPFATQGHFMGRKRR